MGAVKQLWIEEIDSLRDQSPNRPSDEVMLRRAARVRFEHHLFEARRLEKLARQLALHHRELQAAPGQAPINATQYLLLSMLIVRAKPDCWPCMTVSELAELAGIGIRAARYAIADLEDRKLLKREKLVGRATTYDLSGVVEQLESFKGAA